MGKQTDIIELNGKRYDARTGKMLSAHKPAATHSQPAKRTGGSLEGFTKPRPARSASSVRPAHPKVERSKTLMRHAVKKPSVPKTAAKSKPIVKRTAAHHPEANPARIQRAKKIPKSSLISRFGSPTQLKPTTATLAVRPEPPAQTAPILSEHHPTKLDKRAAGSPFDQAIQKATSHQQPHPKKASRRHRVAHKLRVSPRIINITAASLAAVLLIGFIGYQNMPNLSMRLAASRAGVPGTLPNYQPSGFGMSGPIQYKAGQITIHYKSRSDSRAFHINQRSSEWDSATLLDQFVATNRRSYQTYQDNGKTIYIYDNDNATWVDGGIWYQIEGNSSLNSDQLLRLAASM